MKSDCFSRRDALIICDGETCGNGGGEIEKKSCCVVPAARSEAPLTPGRSEICGTYETQQRTTRNPSIDLYILIKVIPVSSEPLGT